MSITERLQQALGESPLSLRHLSNAHVGDIFLADFRDGRRAVVKTDETDAPNLELEGRMLRDLGGRGAVPVPEVWHAEPSLLVMDFVDSGSFSGRAEEHAA